MALGVRPGRTRSDSRAAIRRRGGDRPRPAAIRRSPNRSLPAGGPQAGEKPLFGGRMGLDRAVAQNVADRTAAPRQRPADQQAAVAVERLALRAHQAQAMLRHLGDDAIETGVKLGGGGHRLIVGDRRRDRAPGWSDGRPACRPP